MVFPDRFRHHLLADQLHILNVCFLTPEMRREFGGTAGNIGYNLKLLGEEPLVMATVGRTSNRTWNGLGTRHSDAAVYPGAGAIHRASVHHYRPGRQPDHRFPPRCDEPFAQEPRDAWSAARDHRPDGKEGMLQHARECAASAVLFDPGQGLPMFSGEEIREFLRLADYVAVNDYEGKLLEEKTGRKLQVLAREVKALVCTLGANGSLIFAAGKRHEVPCVRADAVVDPTGCGDAYRAGLLYGIARGWDWDSTGKLGAVMGALKIARRGAQNHAATRDEIERRFRGAFGYSPWRQ